MKKILFGLILVAVLIIAGCADNSYPRESDSTKTISKPKLAKLEPEITIINQLLVDITNRNDYDWHNMKVVANDYYVCIEGMSLESGMKWTLETYGCKDSQGRGGIGISQSLEKIEITTDEGNEIEYVY